MTLRLKGSTSGHTEVKAPASAGSNTLTLPTSNGSAEQFLKNSGTAGELEFSSMVETSTGVGIGTASPSNMLHINGSSPSIRLSDTGANGSAFSIIEDNNGLLKFRNDAGNSGTGSGIAFEVDGSEKLRLDSSGNVGIGTTSPDYRLCVEGTGVVRHKITCTNNHGAGAGVYMRTLNAGSTVGTATIAIDNAGNLKIFSGASTESERMRIASSGNVGIGTTSPGEDLHVFSSAGAIKIDSSGDSALRFAASGTNKFSIFQSGGTLRFFDNTNNAERMRIDSNGIISTYRYNKWLRSDGTTNCGFIGKGDQVISGGSNADFGISTGGGNLLFGSGGTTERARIDSSGRLLVGTTTSNAAPLTVNGVVGFGDSQFRAVFGDGYLDADSTNTFGAGNSEVQIQAHQSNRPAFLSLGGPQGTNEGLGAINFFNSGNTDGKRSRVLILGAQQGSNSDQGGMLLLYTAADGGSSPTERVKIQKDGSFNVYGVYSATGAASANVVVDSGGQLFRSTSSAKYKIDIETIDESYSDALLNCRPVWYRSICSTDNSAHSFWGFIAEEVAEIDPRLVHWKTTEVTYDEKSSAVETPCDPEPEGVAYDRFVPHLLNLIKRQKEQIEAMEARLSALEAG